MNADTFVITSYFTYGTAYVDVCHKYLMPSVQSFGLKSDIRSVPNLGSWEKNTSFKPEFLLTMLERHEDNIVFLDSDAEVLRHPDLFNTIPSEYIFGVHLLDKNAWYGRDFGAKRFELLSGTLWVRNCDESKKVLVEWVNQCKKTNAWEQKVLQEVLEQNNVKVYPLPLSYCYIKTLPRNRPPLVKVEEPFIVHNQVSRLLRHRIR